jgi:hypothetical protein
VEVKLTLPPVQKVVGPEGVIVGVEGSGFTVTVMAFEGAELQPPLLTTTEYVPLVVTEIDWVVAPPGVQILLVGLLLFKVTLPPAQNVVGPAAVIVGVAGTGLTVTTVGAEVAVQPFTSVIWTV